MKRTVTAIMLCCAVLTAMTPALSRAGQTQRAEFSASELGEVGDLFGSFFESLKGIAERGMPGYIPEAPDAISDAEAQNIVHTLKDSEEAGQVRAGLDKAQSALERFVQERGVALTRSTLAFAGLLVEIVVDVLSWSLLILTGVLSFVSTIL